MVADKVGGRYMDVFRQYLYSILSRPEMRMLLVLGVIIWLLIRTLSAVLSPILFSILIAYILQGLVNVLRRYGCGNKSSVLIVYLIFLTLLITFLIWLLPLLWQELSTLLRELPHALQHPEGIVHHTQLWLRGWIPEAQLTTLFQSLGGYMAQFSRELLAFSLASLRNGITQGVYLVMIPIMVFFFLMDGNKIIDWIGQFLPRNCESFSALWLKMREQVNRYMYGKVLEMLIVALISSMVFLLFELNYAILLGVLAGVAVFVPYLGVTIVTIPIVLVGLIEWGSSALFWYLVSAHAAITLLDANLLVPLLFSEVLNLHPLVIILSVLIFGNWFGFWGVFGAIPLATVFHLLIQFLVENNDKLLTN